MLRYYEVEIGGRQARAPAGDFRERRHEAPPYWRQCLARRAVRRRARRYGTPTRSRCSRKTRSRPITAPGRSTRRRRARSLCYESGQSRKAVAPRHSRWRKILWHGRPRWLSLARRAYRADFVVVYFAALTVWNVYSAAGNSGWSAAARWRRRRSASGRPPWRCRAAQLPLRAHDALRRDLAPHRHEDWRRAADLHQHPLQADRLRVHLRPWRRNRRHSGQADVQRADRIFRALAARASVSLREPRALAALASPMSPLSPRL